MPITLKPSQLSALLSKAITNRYPVLVTGAPGIGKSSVVEAAAKDAEADVILSHPVVADQTDAKGMPWIAPGAEHATFLPFGDLHKAMTATKATVWFLDDLGQAQPSVQASYMQLLLAREVNGHKIPDCVTFVAATNRRTDKAGVTGILEPVKSRFVTIVELRADLDDWCSWAMQSNVPVPLIAFLRMRPDLLSAFQASADLTNSPTPRTWAHAAKVLGMNLPQEIEVAAISGAVGEGASAELMSFLRTYSAMPNIDAILLDPNNADIPSDPSLLYAVSTALGARATVKNFAQIARYAERLSEETRGEFAALMIRDAIRRDDIAIRNGERKKKDAITCTDAFVRISCGEFGQLISGQ